MSATMNIAREVAALKRMTVKELRSRYAEVFGETTRSGNKDFLWKRIAWRMQANAEGDLEERARRLRARAEELANDGDLRVRRTPSAPAMEFVQNMAIFTPEGWEPSQIKAEQPTTTYSEFKREILNEIARCLNMPFNVAAGNSSGYNYASGRLDHQTYFKSIRVEQNHLQTVVLDRILKAWLHEAALVEGLLPQALRRSDTHPPNFRGHSWFWDGVEHVDPAKEANAQAARLKNHTTTLAIEYARQGRDWEEELKQRAKEMKLMRQLGLPPQAVNPDVTNDSPTDEDEEDVDDDSTKANAHAA